MNSAAIYVSLPNRSVPLSQVEDFVEPNGKISLQREETPSNRYGSARLSTSISILDFHSIALVKVATIHCLFFSASGESAVLSFVNWLTLSGAEQSGHRGPSTENQEAKQAALLCIKVECSFILKDKPQERKALFCSAPLD